MLETEKRPFPHLQPKTAEFLVAAYHDGAYDRLLTEAQKSETIAQKLNAITYYFHLPNTTLKDTARLLSPQKPFSRERAWQCVQDGINHLISFSSGELQDRFSNEKIPTRKPRTIKSRQQQSLALGGKSVQIAEMASQGLTTQQIQSELKQSWTGMASSRRILKNWGIELDTIKTSAETTKRITAKFKDPNTPDEEINQLLDPLTRGTAAKYISNRSLISVDSIAGMAGLHNRAQENSSISKILELAGLPVKKTTYLLANGEEQHYYLVTAGSLMKSLRVLAKDTSLNQYRENPVKVTFGPEPPIIPNTTDLVKNYGTYPFGKIKAEFGVGASTQLEKILGSDCPVPIFRMRSSGKSHYLKKDEAELRKYLRDRRQRGLL